MTKKTNDRNSSPHVAILGAGPAGVGAAYYLTRQNRAKVTVLELNNGVGGNSGSFEHSGIFLDYGSHRLHPACDPEIFKDIKMMLGEDLLVRPRHGRIRLKQRWIHFPLNPLDLVLRLPIGFGSGVAKDTVLSVISPLRTNGKDSPTFASVLEKQLGKTICQEFYFPYARKIWGLPPEEISAIQAQKRVSANSIFKIIKKVFSKPQNTGVNGKPFFYYPRKGFGQISTEYFHHAQEYGATFHFGARVKQLNIEGDLIRSVIYETENQQQKVTADYIWSTLPLTVLIKSISPPPPRAILDAVESIRFRSMILIYLFLKTNQFTEYDAHYFPGEDIAITRLSEPKNYSGVKEPTGLTALCAELPCNLNDELWKKSDHELGELLVEALEKAGLPVTVPIEEVFTRRLPFAYPIYDRGFEGHFEVLHQYLKRFTNLLSFGRQGLFVHDNTHHALYMARSAVDCLGEDGIFHQDKWQEYLKIFETHVVED